VECKRLQHGTVGGQQLFEHVGIKGCLDKGKLNTKKLYYGLTYEGVWSRNYPRFARGTIGFLVLYCSSINVKLFGPRSCVCCGSVVRAVSREPEALSLLPGEPEFIQPSSLSLKHVVRVLCLLKLNGLQ